MLRAAVVDSNGFPESHIKNENQGPPKKRTKKLPKQRCWKKHDSMILSAECRNGCMQM